MQEKLENYSVGIFGFLYIIEEKHIPTQIMARSIIKKRESMYSVGIFEEKHIHKNYEVLVFSLPFEYYLHQWTVSKNYNIISKTIRMLLFIISYLMRKLYFSFFNIGGA